MKFKRIVIAATLVVFTLILVTIVRINNLKEYCYENHISYDLVHKVGKKCSTMSNIEIAEYFSICAQGADTDNFVEPVDAIINILDCSEDEALKILCN